MSQSEGNSAFVTRAYGASRRLPVLDFIVFGLVTFWVYTAYKIHKHLADHFDSRWSAMVESQTTENHKDSEIYKNGFQTPGKLILVSGLLYFADMLFVLGWFAGFILSGHIPDYTFGMLFVGFTSLLFYLATLLLVLSVTNTVRSHEISEAMLQGLGIEVFKRNDLVPSDDVIARWEKIHGEMTLFLIAALPLTFSPTFGAHLALTADPTFWAVIAGGACFSAAALFHIWGTSFLVGVLNKHLQYEADTIAEPESFQQGTRTSELLPEEKASESQDDARRELMAIMLTDIVGYSKAMEQDEKHAYARLLEHNKIVRTEIKNFRGREIKTIGDAFLVVFTSTLDAVDCAIAIQRTLSEYNQERAEKDQILIRIGIHVGDVLVTDNDVYGDGVNVAARIEPLAEPGGICVSNEVYSLVKKKIELDIEHLQDAKMKNISLAPDVYRIRLGKNHSI